MRMLGTKTYTQRQTEKEVMYTCSEDSKKSIWANTREEEYYDDHDHDVCVYMCVTRPHLSARAV